MPDLPFSFNIPAPDFKPTRVDNHIIRRLSDLKGQFYDQEAYQALLAEEDQVLYEVFEIQRPNESGELLSGVSVIHPGKVGSEFFMTKGHFHAKLDTAEIYYCLSGEGLMVMETPDGKTDVKPLIPGNVLYVPPFWAHRSVCTSRQNDLVLFFVYPGNAGHDYGTIEENGFRRLVMDSPEGIKIIDNPRFGE